MKPTKRWQEKQWYSKSRPSIDLSTRLQKIEVQKYPKLNTWRARGRRLLIVGAKWLLGLSALGMIGIILYLSVGIPWHIKLFGYWLLRKEEINSIPAYLHSELNNLCQTADNNGQVDGYQGSNEIAYGLGRFQCLASQDERAWLIRDTYGFNEEHEALAGTQLAEFLVILWGENYTYKIEAIIPRKQKSPSWGVVQKDNDLSIDVSYMKLGNPESIVKNY